MVVFDSELITAISGTQAPTSPLSLQAQQQPPAGKQQLSSQRQHQVLIAGTSEGALKRLVVAPNGLGELEAHEFDSFQLDESRQQPVLADLLLQPAHNPQLLGPTGETQQQFLVAATAHRLVKLRVNSCPARARAGSRNSTTVDECLSCAHLRDPFCGWCASTGSCLARDECLAAAAGLHNAADRPVLWSPFDSIRCADYQPLAPALLPLQAEASQLVEVNVRLQQPATRSAGAQLAAQLAQSQFSCHFDYLAAWNRSAARLPRPSGATTKAAQARLNLHASTVAIGCPLPAASQRPAEPAPHSDSLRVRLAVRLAHPSPAGAGPELEQALGMRSGQQPEQQVAGGIERELTLFDCSVHADCRSCLGPPATSGRRFVCAWCPLSNRCTFNASHPDLGCAASAVASTTPQSAPGQIRGSHLTASLDRAQASVLSISMSHLAQCPPDSPSDGAGVGDEEASANGQQAAARGQDGAGAGSEPGQAKGSAGRDEILVPNNVRRSIQLQLRHSIQTIQPQKRVTKLECLIEVEGAKARVAARLVDGHLQVACQETLLSYQAELATQRAQLQIILNDHQLVETHEGELEPSVALARDLASQARPLTANSRPIQ